MATGVDLVIDRLKRALPQLRREMTEPLPTGTFTIRIKEGDQVEVEFSDLPQSTGDEADAASYLMGGPVNLPPPPPVGESDHDSFYTVSPLSEADKTSDPIHISGTIDLRKRGSGKGTFADSAPSESDK